MKLGQKHKNIFVGFFVQMKALKWLWLKCIVGQSWAKLGKVDMFSKEVIKKRSWQSWCIFLYIFKHNMQSKVGKVQMWIFYSRQSWQSWGCFWENLASLKYRQSWQSWNITFLINWNNSDPRQSWQSWGYFWTKFASF